MASAYDCKLKSASMDKNPKIVLMLGMEAKAEVDVQAAFRRRCRVAPVENDSE